MKKLFALILVCVLCVATASAAEWREGLGPAKPYPGVREMDLTKEMGYGFFYPTSGLAAERFCDILEIFLPREDVVTGDGHAHLYDANGEIADIDFSNPDQVEIRKLEEVELEELRWGNGVSVEMHLPVSLKSGDQGYYVLMDQNCFLAGEGKNISNYFLDKPEQWVPVMGGDFGIEGLYYSAAPEPAEEEEVVEEPAEDAEATPEVTEAPVDEGPIEPKYNPTVGDEIHFNLVLGGDAKTAVLYSENDSATFPVMEFTASATVKGVITKDDLDWGVVFLDENDEVLDNVKPKWATQTDTIVELPEQGPGTGAIGFALDQAEPEG